MITAAKKERKTAQGKTLGRTVLLRISLCFPPTPAVSECHHGHLSKGSGCLPVQLSQMLECANHSPPHGILPTCLPLLSP